MNELEFKVWMNNNNINKKVQSDLISRLKKIEREINHCDIDEEYRSDRCEYLLSLFCKSGNNDEMLKLKYVNLPIGKYQISTYKYALKKYISFMEESSQQ